MDRKRVLVASDIHLCHVDWYGMENSKRVKRFIEDVKKEYEKDPFEMLLLLGDYSLDHWVFDIGGSYLREGLSNTKNFVDDYLSEIKEMGIPVYMIPGNHEQYGHEDWEKFTGGKRETYAVLDDYLFILDDTYAGVLDPKEHSDGIYKPVNIERIKNLMNKYPDKKVFLCSHFYDPRNESEEFKEFCKNEKRIIAMMCGHIHVSKVWDMREAFGKMMLMTGNYSYSSEKPAEDSLWGFRDLILTDNSAESRYITVDADYIIDGKELHRDYGYQDTYKFEF